MYRLSIYRQIYSASQVACQDTYLLYCILHIPMLNAPQKLETFMGKKFSKRVFFVPCMWNPNPHRYLYPKPSKTHTKTIHLIILVRSSSTSWIIASAGLKYVHTHIWYHTNGIFLSIMGTWALLPFSGALYNVNGVFWGVVWHFRLSITITFWGIVICTVSQPT